MIEKLKATVPLNFTVNPILIYDIWIASKVSRLNALTEKNILFLSVDKKV